MLNHDIASSVKVGKHDEIYVARVKVALILHETLLSIVSRMGTRHIKLQSFQALLSALLPVCFGLTSLEFVRYKLINLPSMFYLGNNTLSYIII